MGGDNGGPLALADGGAGGGPGALDAHIEDDHVAVTLVHVGCAGSCATVQAVASGGRPPYSYVWEDGSTSAVRQLCPAADSGYVVKVTDTGTSGEFGHPAQTAQAAVTAQVLNCSDAGTGGDAGADGPAPGPDTVYWATWSAVTLGDPGAAQGTISPPGGDVAVSYTGRAVSGSAPTGQPSNWALGVMTFDPMSTYVSATVADGPPPSG